MNNDPDCPDYEDPYCEKYCDNCKKWLSKEDRKIIEEEMIEVLVSYRIDGIETVFKDILYHITDEKYLLAFHNMLIPCDEFSNESKAIRKKIWPKE